MTSSIWEKFSSRAWRAVSAVGRGGEGRQCKHHPIYVQREERFQFLWLFYFFFQLPHTQRASPRSFPSAATQGIGQRGLGLVKLVKFCELGGMSPCQLSRERNQN